MHELKLQVVQEIRSCFKVPYVNHDSLFVKSSVSWFVLVPYTFHLEGVRKCEKQNAEVYLREELGSFDVKPSPDLCKVEQFLLVIDSVLDVSVNPLFIDLRDKICAYLEYLAYFAKEMFFLNF